MNVPALIGKTNLSLRLHRVGRSAILNGTGTSASINASGELTAVVTETIAYSNEVLAVSIYDTVQAKYLWYPDADSYVYIPSDTTATYYVGSQAVALLSASFFVPPPVTRSVDDTNPIRITTWPVASATLSGTVEFSDGTERAIAGAFSYIGVLGSNFEYELAYSAADRPSERGTARYTITDGANTRYLTLEVIDLRLTAEESDKIALIGTGAGVISSPVYRGKIESIVIGDAYLRANGDDFEFTIPDPGLTVATTTVWFGGNSSTTATSWLVQGTIADNGTTWTLSFELTDTITDALDCGYYKWSVATRDANSKERTRVSSNGQEVTALMHKQTDGSDPNC